MRLTVQKKREITSISSLTKDAQNDISPIMFEHKFEIQTNKRESMYSIQSLLRVNNNNKLVSIYKQ